LAPQDLFFQATRIARAEQENPPEILRRRYAQGEIDKAEFEEQEKDTERAEA
jgi:uncharacterized membrane protein